MSKRKHKENLNVYKDMKRNVRDNSSMHHETEHGCKLQTKRPYSRMTISPIMAEIETPILAGSVVGDSVITSVGQELGPTYDISGLEVDVNTAKTFNDEWEVGF